MNLQEQTNRIKRMMGVINEEYPKTIMFLGNINWYQMYSMAKDWFGDIVREIVMKESHNRIPSDYYNIILGVLPSTNGQFFTSLLNDISKGSLSQKTIDNFRSEFYSKLSQASKNSKVVSDLTKLPPKAISVAKSVVFRPVIKFYIDKYYKLLGNELFIKGLLDTVIEYGDHADRQVLANSKKVLNQLSYSITNDTKLKNDIYNLVFSFISKL